MFKVIRKRNTRQDYKLSLFQNQIENFDFSHFECYTPLKTERSNVFFFQNADASKL